MIINTTVHAVVQEIVNIEETNKDDTVKLSKEPAAPKYLFKSKTLIWLKKQWWLDLMTQFYSVNFSRLPQKSSLASTGYEIVLNRVQNPFKGEQYELCC